MPRFTSQEKLPTRILSGNVARARSTKSQLQFVSTTPTPSCKERTSQKVVLLRRLRHTTSPYNNRPNAAARTHPDFRFGNSVLQLQQEIQVSAESIMRFVPKAYAILGLLTFVLGLRALKVCGSMCSLEGVLRLKASG